MQVKFVIDGNNVLIFRANEDLMLDKLPAKVYTIRYNQMTGYYLETLNNFLETPDKIYGETIDRANKCIKTYQEREMSTGILLTGDKGTGKSLLMAILANKVIKELNLPVILIKEAQQGANFVSFIESIGECVLVFDEFGKMYTSGNSYRNNSENDVPQQSLLSLMDGANKTKRMIIFTENSELDISEFMMNRPSRVYYHFRYRKLDEISIVGYCNDFKVNAEAVKDIIELSRRSRIFSFDMLQSIVEEQLRFNGSVDDIVADLNIDLREERGAMMEVTKVMERNTEIEREIFDTPIVQRPEFNNYTYIKVKNKKDGIERRTAFGATRADIHVADESCSEEEEQAYREVYVQAKDLAYEQGNKLVYETDEYVFVAKAIEPTRSTYFSLLA